MDSLIPAVEDMLREVAEREIMTRFRRLKPEDVRHKQRQGDLVTVADLEAEHHIRAGLKTLLPESHVVGEEGAHKKPEILEHLRGDGPVWVVDPIDGTRNFATGKPCFAVICALVENGQTRMGWILDPISGICAVAEKGQGARVSDRPITVRAPERAEDLCGSVGDGVRKRLEKHLNDGGPAVPRHLVRYHCVGREYMDLLMGKLHFGLYGGQLMPWDHAAGCLMVAEAGGIVRTVEGARAYEPANHGHGNHLLISPDEKTFESLCRILVSR